MSPKLILSLLFPLLIICYKQSWGQSDIRFIENKGQWDDRVRYKAPLFGGEMYIENNAVTFAFVENEPHHETHPETHTGSTNVQAHAYQVAFVGANAVHGLQALQPYPEVHHYYMGNDPTQWAEYVSLHHKIKYENIWDGIDMEYYGKTGHLKYDIIVHPQANWINGQVPALQLAYQGIDPSQIHIDEAGNLQIQTSVNSITEEKPYAYQMIGGVKQEVACEYRLNGQILSFQFSGNYDISQDIIIDPTVIFSTYTGSFQDNWGFTATYDNAGNAYAGGIVYNGGAFGATGYPTSIGAFQTFYQGGGRDASITKYNPTGTAIIFSTYLGGSNEDQPHSMIVNSQNELFVMGRTNSFDFPATAGAYDTTHNGGFDLYIMKFSSTGTLLAGTFLGGNLDDGNNTANSFNYSDDARGEIILDGAEDVYITSCSKSGNYPTSPGCYQSFLNGTQDAVVSKLNPALSTLIWSSYFGGGYGDSGYGIKVDNANNAFITGGTQGSNLPTTPGVFQNVYAGGAQDGFVAKFNATGTNILASSYIGTNAYDQSYLIQLDLAQNVYLSGQTLGSFPLVNTGYSNPNANQFITKLDNNLTNIIYSTTFGDPTAPQINISPTAFLVDICENVYVAGWGGGTNSFGQAGGNTNNMPLTPNAYQSSTDGSDFYVIVLEPNATNLLYGTYFGGSVSQEHVDGGTSRFDPNGIIYEAVCASCNGYDPSTGGFPTTPGVWGTNNNASNCNLGLFKIDFDFIAIAAAISAPDSGCVNTPISFVNNSTGATTYSWNFGDGATSTLSNPVHTYTTAGTYTVTLIAYPTAAACNVPDTTQEQIVILPSPTIAFTLTDSICVTGTATAQYTGSAVVGYSWNFGNATVVSGNNGGPYTLSWTTAGVQTVTLVDVTNTFGCIAGPVSQSVTVLAIPTSGFTLTDSICISQDALATYTGNAPANSSFAWTFGGGTAVPGTGVGPHTINWQTSGFHPVTLTVSAYGCVGLPFTDSVYVEQSPSASFSMPDSICLGQTAVATYNGVNYPGATYSWDFGGATGGGTGIGPHTLLFSPAGNYTVSLSLASNNGCPSDTVTQDIIVYAYPTSTFTFPDSICEGNQATITYTGTASAIASYVWSWGNAIANPGTGQGPHNLSFPAVSNYPISLSVSEHGCQGTPTIHNISVTDVPLIDFSLPDSACLFLNVFAAYTGQPFSNLVYHWDFDGATILSGSAGGPYSLSWNTAGMHTVSLWVEHLGCPSDTLTKEVYLVPGPPAGILVAPKDICITDFTTVSFSGVPKPTYSYVWNFAGGNAVPGVGAGPHMVNWVTPGPKNITLSIIENGCPGPISTETVTVYAPPVAQFAYPDSICEGDINQVVFTGIGSPNGIYNWSWGNAVIVSGSGQGPYTMYWTSPGTHTICLQVTEPACPPSTTVCHNFTVLEQPVAAISPVSNQCFTNNSMDFSYAGTVGVDAYFWGFPGGFPSSSNLPNPTGIHYNSPGVYTAWAYVVKEGCISDTAFVDFEIVAEPDANFIHTGSPYCVGTCVNFQYSGNPLSPQSYDWNFGANSSPMLTTLTNPGCVLFFTPGIHSISLIVNHKGCRDTAIQEIYIHPTPMLNVGGDLTFCQGLGPIQIDATVTGGSPGYGYSWTSIPAAVGGINPNPYVEDPYVNPTDTTLYILQVLDTVGCKSNTDTVRVVPLPHPKIYAGPDQKICDYPGAPGVFLQAFLAPDNEAPGPFHFQWTPTTGMAFGQDTLLQPYVHPTNTTIYVVVATSANGCSSDPLDTASTVIVDVIPKPIVDAGPTQEMCKGDSLQMLGAVLNGGGTYTYAWTPMDAESGLADFQLLHTMASPAFTHLYTLVVSAGGCQGSDTVTLVVHTLPTAAIHPPVTDICQGDSVLLTGLADGDPFGTIYTYTWTPSTGISSPHSAITWAHPSITSTFSLEVGSAHCHGFVDDITITVRPTATAEIMTPDTLICFGDSVLLDVAYNFNGTPVSGPVLFQWNPQAGLASATQAQTWAFPTENTTYQATVSVGGSCKTYDEITVLVSPKPTAIAIADTTILCGNASTFLHASGGFGSSTYSWTPSASLNNATSQNPVASPDSYTLYTVWVSEGNCKDSASVAIAVRPAPVADYFATNLSGCAPLTVQFTQQATDALQYIWNMGDGSPVENEPVLTHTFTSPGTYPVSLIVLGEDGCRDTAQHGSVYVSSPPVAMFSSNPPAYTNLILPDASIAFENLSLAGSSYHWSFGDGAISAEKSPQHTYELPSEYLVLLTVTNEYGCVDTATALYRVLPPDLFVPNIFTPDGDGIHDDWGIIYTGDEKITIEVFDRWGVKYFSAENALTRWKGTTIDGGLAKEGAYFYSLKVGKKIFSGYITLVR